MSGDDLSDSSIVCERILKIFSEKLHIEIASEGQDLIDGGLLDSLALLTLLRHLESEFGFVIPIEELEVDDLRSVSTITALVIRTGWVSPAATSPEIRTL